MNPFITSSVFTRFVFAFGFPSAQDIANAIVGAIGTAILGFFNAAGIVSTLLAPVAPLFNLIVSTPPDLTYTNQAVLATWQVMVFAADALLVLVVMGGGLQMMVGMATGTVFVPPREFLPKVFAGAIAINASMLWGSILIQIENGLCTLAQLNIQLFIQQVSLQTSNHPPTAATLILANFVLAIVFAVVFVFLIFEMVMRIVLLDLLLVLSPLAMLMWVLPQTQPWAAFWSRTFAITVFVQFFQILAFSLGADFLFAAAPNLGSAIANLIIAVGIMFLIGRIPRYLYRFGNVAASGGGGNMIGTVVRTALTAAALFA